MGRRRRVQEGVQNLRERGYRLRLLSAAFRNHMHWSELVGGDVVISPPYEWQLRFNASDIGRAPDGTTPWMSGSSTSCYDHFEDFAAPTPRTESSVEELDGFGATRRTLRQFIARGRRPRRLGPRRDDSRS